MESLKLQNKTKINSVWTQLSTIFWILRINFKMKAQSYNYEQTSSKLKNFFLLNIMQNNNLKH